MMTNDDLENFDIGSLEDAMKNLQNAYSDGLGSMNQAGEEVADEMIPSHKIIIDVKNSAKVEGYSYKVDAHLEFLVDLDSVLNNEKGDISALLGGLGVDLSDEESDQVVEQLGTPRCIGILDDFKINEIELSGEKGMIKNGINEKGTALITLDDKKIYLSFESVFALPELQSKQSLFYAIPSQKKMQENIVLNIDNLEKEISFGWVEKDKDNLKVKGKVRIIELK